MSDGQMNVGDRVHGEVGVFDVDEVREGVVQGFLDTSTGKLVCVRVDGENQDSWVPLDSVRLS